MNDWLLELTRGTRVLDLASASGSFSLCGLACSVLAIDEDPDAFRAARPIGEGMHGRIVARSEQLPIASCAVDLVVCNHALEHLLKLDSTLDEVRRVLKPTGRFYVSVPWGYGFGDYLYRGRSKGVVTSTASGVTNWCSSLRSELVSGSPNGRSSTLHLPTFGRSRISALRPICSRA
jgi:SAM-dependent methyltransferase